LENDGDPGIVGVARGHRLDVAQAEFVVQHVAGAAAGGVGAQAGVRASRTVGFWRWVRRSSMVTLLAGLLLLPGC
jgi:hypothetical protein